MFIYLVRFSLAIFSQKKIPFVKGSPFKNNCATSMPPNSKQQNWKCKKQKIMTVLFQIIRFLICLNEAKRLQHGETLGCKVPFAKRQEGTKKAPLANSPFVKMSGVDLFCQEIKGYKVNLLSRITGLLQQNVCHSCLEGGEAS